MVFDFFNDYLPQWQNCFAVFESESKKRAGEAKAARDSELKPIEEAIERAKTKKRKTRHLYKEAHRLTHERLERENDCGKK